MIKNICNFESRVKTSLINMFRKHANIANKSRSIHLAIPCMTDLNNNP